ncbi:uncharacterized protein LOC117105515 [Anneissia japonica]|uniref:uncharacterized protein LOC117105515 n=1 Tax=Anneissia japonica TaxID=1529436 RepID=UPI001425781B|nr:uncharacterized protein LOC117105515 [Anneissia japonica]
MGKIIGLLLLLGSICRCSAGVAFPSGIVFEPVNFTDVTEENLRYYADQKNTGTELFLTSEHISKKLSLSLKVSDFVDTSSLYFRAHPKMFECLQKVNTNMSESGKIRIVNGYKPDGLITERNDQNRYIASGAGCDFKVEDFSGFSLSMHNVADVVIQLCVPIFQKINRDIGIAVMDDRVHLHIRGAEDGEPYFSVQDGSMTDGEFKEHALDVIDKAYDPVKFPSTCSVDPFTSGETYPDHVTSAEEAVGKVDYPIRRNDTEEFKKLVQYPARLIDFENSEHSSAWCGLNTRSCIDCRQTIHGSTLSSRCSDRTMTARLMSVLQKVQKMTSNAFTGEKLVVMEAWDEAYADAPELNGDNPEGSLHYEGRAATVRLSGGDAARLSHVASFARCSGADYVKHNGDHIFIAVQKQAGSVAKKVQFPSNQLIVVAPPNSQLPHHELPVRFQAYGDETMPLFDSDHQMDKLVSLDSPLSNFVSMESRYLRLNPLLTRCYQALITKENKWREGKPAINIQVLWSYLTSTQRDSMLGTEDPRYETPTLGRAMQVMYDAATVDDSKSFTTRRLSNLIAHQCGPIFQTPGYQIGIGLYTDSVFVDLRSSFKAWVEDEELLSEETEEEFAQDLRDRTKAALESRLIDPDDKETACKSTVKPQKQSIEFHHTFPELWSTFTPVNPGDCQPMVNTEFCKETKNHREEEVNRLWTEITRKHLYRAKNDVKNALEGCFGDCSTCEEGVYYESKIENCNNLLHWIPFEFLEERDKSNFYARENEEMKAYACQEHCIDSSPLFSLFAPSVEADFRFDPKKSAKQDLYTTNENPLPVNDLMYKLYALYSKGTVKFWILDETELLTLKNPLQVLMVYNKDVTDIEINVAATVNMNSVINVMKSLIMDWSTTGCPDYSRESMPPFSVRGITNQL